MIYLECNPDKVLIKALGISKREIDHAGSKGSVCRKLEKDRNSKGLVDEDPLSSQPSYIGRLKILSEEDEIRLLYDEKSQNHLIILCPRLEEWILKVAKEIKIDVSSYGLSNDASKLHKTINVKIEDFKRLTEDIVKQKSRKIETLKRFIKGT